MLLTDKQRDALTELINIGFGRAAGALSILVGQRVLLEAPDVHMYPIEDLANGLEGVTEGEITTVHQLFSGQLSGDAMLLMNTISATTLVDLLHSPQAAPSAPRELTQADREALSEAGNILLNAFIGSFGNLLRVHITFTVPHLRMESLNNMLRTLMIEQHAVEYALLVRVHFRLKEGSVGGYVVIVMGIESMEELLESLRVVGYLD